MKTIALDYEQEIAHLKKHREAIIKRIGLEKYQELLLLFENHLKKHQGSH